MRHTRICWIFLWFHHLRTGGSFCLYVRFIVLKICLFIFLVALFSHQPCHFHVVGGTIIQFTEFLLLVAMVLSIHFSVTSSAYGTTCLSKLLTLKLYSYSNTLYHLFFSKCVLLVYNRHGALYILAMLSSVSLYYCRTIIKKNTLASKLQRAYGRNAVT